MTPLVSIIIPVYKAEQTLPACLAQLKAQTYRHLQIIFIDDLDRLVPAKAVELLEVLKLFLDCEGCVFILAIDSNVIIKGIKDKYGEDIAKDKGKAFFDKIIQVPFTVPLKQYDMKKFIQSALVNDISIFNSLDSKELLIIEKLILNSLGNNPRGIKRLFNHYSLLLYIQNIEDGVDVNQWSNREKIQLLSVLCLQLGFDNIYNTFLDMIELGKLKDELYNLESDWSSQEPGAINGEIVPLLKTEFIKIFCSVSSSSTIVRDFCNLLIPSSAFPLLPKFTPISVLSHSSSLPSFSAFNRNSIASSYFSIAS